MEWLSSHVMEIINVITVSVVGFFAYKINSRLSDLHDSVELYATSAINKTGDKEIPIIHIQNVGTRHVYFDRYIFNGKIYKLDGQVRPPTYCGAENNFYWIELPTNGESHASVVIEYHDIDNRRWSTEIFANLTNGFWKLDTMPRKIIKGTRPE